MTAPAPAARRVEVAQRALLFSLPTLATVALYLPGGLLMPARLVIAALAACAAWQLASRRVPARTPVLVGAVTACGVIVACGVVALLRYHGHVAALMQLGFALLAVCAAAVLGRDRGSLHALLWGWLASAAVAGTVGFWEIATARHLPGNAPARQWADVVPGWNVISSFFDNPNLYAYHCTVTLLLLPALYRIGRRTPRVAVLVATPLLVVLLLWTSGRIALLAAVLGIGVWALSRRWSRWGFAAAAAALAATMALDVPPGRQVVASARMLIENLQWGELTSSGTRLQLIRAGWWMAERSSLLGVGPGRFPDLARDPTNPHVAEFVNPHFGLIELLAEYGAVALAAFLAALVAGAVRCTRSLWRARHDEARGPERTLALAALVLVVVTPLLSATHSTWLAQPLAAAHMATLTALLAALPSRAGDEA